MITAHTCHEMLKLRDMLDKLNIDYTDDSDSFTPNNSECICYRTKFYYNSNRYSVVYGYGTYGGWNPFSEKDSKLLELMINGEEPTGWHTAEDIIKILKERENIMRKGKRHES